MKLSSSEHLKPIESAEDSYREYAAAYNASDVTAELGAHYKEAKDKIRAERDLLVNRSRGRSALGRLINGKERQQADHLRSELATVIMESRGATPIDVAQAEDLLDRVEKAGEEHYLQNKTAYHEEALEEAAKAGVQIKSSR